VLTLAGAEVNDAFCHEMRFLQRFDQTPFAIDADGFVFVTAEVEAFAGRDESDGIAVGVNDGLGCDCVLSGAAQDGLQEADAVVARGGRRR
jgi:hypothetical protein